MDSNSDSCETFSPKIEPDWDTDREVYKKDTRLNWNSENTMKLIETIENECKELWDTKHPLNKHRGARQLKHEYLADMFGTTSEEISRKIHNLRTQFNNEVRKIKRKQSCFGEGSGTVFGGSGWEYFDALSFLMREPLSDPMDNVEGVNLALAEFQADEEDKFGAAVRAKQSMYASLSPCNIGVKEHAPLRVAASTPPPLPASANPMMWPEEPLLRIRHSVKADECQLAEFQADEEEKFGAAVRAKQSMNASLSPRNIDVKVHAPLRVAASAPPPLPASANPMMWPEEPLLRLRPSVNSDECQIFGDFVASELRTLRSDDARKRLKRVIQKAILEIGDEEDINIFTG